MRIRKYYDQAANGGSTGDAKGNGASGDAKGGNAGVTDANANAGGKPNDGGAGAGAGGDRKIDTAALLKERDDLLSKSKSWETERKTLTEKLGKQAESVGLVNKFDELMGKGDKKTALSTIAEKYGLKVKFDEPDDDGATALAKAIKSGDEGAASGVYQKLRSEIMGELRQEFGGVIGTVSDMQMESKYPNWSTLAPSRMELATLHSKGLVSTAELLHMAISYQELITKLPDFQTAAIEEYVAQLAQKDAGNLSDGSGGGGGRGKKKAGQEFAKVVGLFR